MRREWIAITGISLACIAVWMVLFFTFFTGNDVESEITTENDETIFEYSDDQLAEEQEENTSPDSSEIEVLDNEGVEAKEINSDDNTTIDKLSSTDFLVDSEEQELLETLMVDNISERGIHQGDLDHLISDGVISIDVVLKEIFEEDF
ncbi:hypothetical protein ACM26V_11225 [Salipaludibacillus sp. HK11]|uniref:hypothetical protein n=1 Tax=Salipaludibacillus sp. HK11 TaxID=3394320 RepID=UPI0039FC6BC1